MISPENHDRDRTESYTVLTRGTRCNHYEIVNRVASGGMGEVYSAYDTHLEREIALKFLPDGLAPDKNARTRFRREARAAARLGHPNIVTIHDVGELNTRPYIAMEYVKGRTLSARIRSGPMPVATAGKIAIQIAQGLQAAHRERILHRDIKPSNIIITDDGTAKILDFGLAWIAETAGSVSPSTVVGTVGYSSPEQLTGKQVDERSDIWSWGVVLYEMLTGRMPFKGSDPGSTVYATLNHDPEDPASLRSDLPDCLRDVCMRCLRRDPAERPQSIDEILDMLGECPSDILLPAGIRVRQRSKIALGVLSVMLTILLAWQFLFEHGPEGQVSTSSLENRRLAVLPFRLSGIGIPGDWPDIIQTLFVNDLTGAKGYGVVDPLTLNSILPEGDPESGSERADKWYRTIDRAEIPRAIDGIIMPSSGGYTIQSTVLDTDSRTVQFATEVEVSGEEGLFTGIATLAERIADYLEAELPGDKYQEDIQPWIEGGTRDIKALRAFMQASRMIFNGVPGAEKYLRQAIETDSMFIAPRIWLIPTLVATGRVEEARHQQEILQDLKERANLFEQAMIGGVEPLIKGDIRSLSNAFQLALTYSPRNNILLFNLAAARRQLQDYRGAVNALKPVIADDWQYSYAYSEMAYSKMMLGEYESAQKALEEGLSIRPLDPDIHLLLGILLRRKNQTAEAAKQEEYYIREQTNGDTSRADALATLAEWSLDFQLLDLGIIYSERALSENPKAARPHFIMGQIHETRGDTDLARSSYEIYLRIDSTSSTAGDVRRRLQELKTD